MTFTVEYEREEDGRSLAEVVELPGVLAYGADTPIRSVSKLSRYPRTTFPRL